MAVISPWDRRAEARAQGEDDAKTIYVVSNGGHAGLVLPGRELAEDVWPDAHDYRHYDNVEVGTTCAIALTPVTRRPA